MGKNAGTYIKGLVVMLVLLMLGGLVASAEEGNRGARERELSKNGQVHQERYDEILANLDKYEYVENFRLTRYVPRDATEDSWVDTTKSIDGASIKSVHWYQEGSKWVFSSASAERYEIAKDKFSGRAMKETSHLYGGSADKIIWQLVFDEDVSKTDRKTILPLDCKASIQYSGDPFTGAHGYVDWGSVAADVKGGVLDRDAKLFIQGYGKGDVHDVGGGIKGRHLDLFVDNCEEGMAGGNTTNNLVIYETSKSSIPGGKPVTKEILDKVMNGKKWGDGGNGTGTGTGAGGSGSGGAQGDYEAGKREQFSPFRTHNHNTSVVGIEASNSALPGELSYVLAVKSEGAYKLMQKLMFLFSAGLIVFVSLQITSLVLMKKEIGNGVTGRAETMLFGKEGAGEPGQTYMKMVLVNILLLMMVMTLVLGSYYTAIQGKIYAGIAYIVDFVL